MIPVLSPEQIQELLVENNNLKVKNAVLESRLSVFETQLEQARKLTIIALVEYFKVAGDISVNRIQSQHSKDWTIHSNDLVVQVTEDDINKIEHLFPEGEPMLALGQNSMGDLLMRLVPEPKEG